MKVGLYQILEVFLELERANNLETVYGYVQVVSLAGLVWLRSLDTVQVLMEIWVWCNGTGLPPPPIIYLS